MRLWARAPRVLVFEVGLIRRRSGSYCSPGSAWALSVQTDPRECRSALTALRPIWDPGEGGDGRFERPHVR